MAGPERKRGTLIYLPRVAPEAPIADSDLEALLKSKEALVAEARRYVKGQVDLWRRIPNLALEADLRQGAPQQTNSAYVMGNWHFGNGLTPEDEDYEGDTFVDLENGDLFTRIGPQYIGIDGRHFYRELDIQPAADEDVFRLLQLPQQLSAEEVIRQLTEAATFPYVTTFAREGIEEYKEKQRQTYSITPIYTRPPIPDNQLNLD